MVNGSMFFMGFLVLKIGGIMAFVDGVVGYIFRVSLGPGLGIPTSHHYWSYQKGTRIFIETTDLP